MSPVRHRPDADPPARPSPMPAKAAAQVCCEYCGEAVAPRHRIERTIGGKSQVFCCLGCAFIAEQLAMLPGPTAEAAPGPAPTPAGAQRLLELDVRGMVCAACAQLVEHSLRKSPGVHVAHVDFVTHRAHVVYDAGRTDAAALAQRVAAAGYRVRTRADAAADRRAERIELLRVLIAWLVMMQVMMLAVPAYLARPGEIAPDIAQMLRIAQLVLTAPAALFCTAPFWRAAASQLRARQPGMEVPVAIGLAGALAASVAATWQGRGAVYFDSVTMFVALLLTVRWWQVRALARANARIDAAASTRLLRAQRVRPGTSRSSFETVAATELRCGDEALVPTGEAFPADGVLVEGSTSLSQAWLTGESAALERSEGDEVLAGSLNLGQAVVLRVTRAGEATSLAALQRLIVDAASRRPPALRLANRVGGHFAAAVLVLAGLTALYWAGTDGARAVQAAIAVLVVSCPCALSLAAPLAYAVAQAQLAARGVLVTRPGALEDLARVDTVALDKTGTLTEDRPQLIDVQTPGMHARGLCLAIAAGLEARSRHPYARAIVAAAERAGQTPLAAVRTAEAAGLGVEGVVAGVRLRLGKPDYALALMRDPQAGARALSRLQPGAGDLGTGRLVLAGEQGMLAVLRFGETLRADASALLRGLAADGRRIVLLSGDAAPAVARVAQALGTGGPLQLECLADRDPAAKRAAIAERQAQGRRVAMVGDGVNDAPVLAQADASIALAGGAQLAQVRADVILLGARLLALRETLATAVRSARIVRQNFAWALGYNLLLLPLAASGRLLPWLAASGMAASSAVVLFNSLRLRRSPDGPLAAQDTAPWTPSIS